MQDTQQNTVVLPELEALRARLRDQAMGRRRSGSTYVAWAAAANAKAEALELAAGHPGPWTLEQLQAVARALNPYSDIMSPGTDHAADLTAAFAPPSRASAMTNGTPGTIAAARQPVADERLT